MATKVKAAPEPEENPNLAIWNAVCRTDPRHTKKVNQRGGFTAINANYQIQEATRQFGPVGVGWGYVVGEAFPMGQFIVVPVTLWHGSRDNTFGPILGCTEMLGQRPDHDAPKKAMTDAITKGLSQLGFNADVFLGLYDDNKYVEQMRQEFGGPPANDGNGGGKDDPFPQGPCKNKTELKAKGRELWREIEGCGDSDELEALLRDKGTVALTAQLVKALPDWWTGRSSGSTPFDGLEMVINRKRDEFAQQPETQHPFSGG